MGNFLSSCCLGCPCDQIKLCHPTHGSSPLITHRGTMQCSSGDSCPEGTYWDSSETVGGRSQRQPPEQGWCFWLSKSTYLFLHTACAHVQVLCGWCHAGSQGLSDCLTNPSKTTDSFPGIHISVNDFHGLVPVIVLWAGGSGNTLLSPKHSELHNPQSLSLSLSLSPLVEPLCSR